MNQLFWFYCRVIFILSASANKTKEEQLPQIRGIASRWTDLFSNQISQNNEHHHNTNNFLKSILIKRENDKEDYQRKIEISTNSKSLFYTNNDKKFLWCFLPRDDAGLVSQMRHLVECSILAKKLKRKMISPPLFASGMDPSGQPRFWDELVDFAQINSVHNFEWHSGAYIYSNEYRVSVDVHTSALQQRTSSSRKRNELLTTNVGFKHVVERKHGTSESLTMIGKRQKNQQTLLIVFDTDVRRATEPMVASLQPVAWLRETSKLMRFQLFGDVNARLLAMSLVRGGDVSRCIQRSIGRREVMNGGGGSELDDIMLLMRQCFQSDDDVEAVVKSVQNRFGPMEVYLTGDEQSEDSLHFFQGHGYKTRVDSAVVRGHLRQTDVLFLDFLLCRNSSLFIGNSNNKLSKQIISLRDALKLPSFLLKTAQNDAAPPVKHIS